jgi:uncharacterized protein (DUF302 family)
MSAPSSFDSNRRALLQMTAAGAAALAAGIGQSRAQPATRTVAVERLSVVSAKTFDAVVAAFESSIGRPDMRAFLAELSATKTYQEMEKVVEQAVGPSGVMEFVRFDLGFVLQKEPGHGGAKSLRFLVGNPLIMKEMTKHVPDAGSYAPVTVLIDQRMDGVHLSYDRFASLLAPYGNADASQVARDLDAKIENICRTAAA